MMMMKQLLSVTLGVSLMAFSAQAQDSKMDHSKMDQKDHTEMTMSYDAPEAFQEQLAEVYEASLDLKEAFVASDTLQVRKAVSPVQDALFEIDMKLLKDKAHRAWMDQLKTLRSSLEAIDKANTIMAQRESFADFSQALYQSVKAFGIGGEEAYYQYCPMANDNQGAYWLSDTEKIRNPYFGDKMLTCGSVKETIN
jgi:Cu(I)/Ag(I) efflux system membrane fusion protein